MVTAAALSLVHRVRGASVRPPIVLVTIDTLRSDHLPVYGYAQVETPAIDALRADGLLFRHAWSQVPLTLPSHASLFTGRLPNEHGVRDNVGYTLDGERWPTLAARLRAAGYRTGAAVSAIVLAENTGIAAGFEVYDDEIHDRVTRGLAGLQRSGGATLERALAWLGGIPADQPFFLFLHVYEPHAPYQPPEPHRGRYASLYDGEIATADAVVADLIAALRARGDYHDALVVLLSDHGEGLGEHGEEGHGVFLYRHDLQVPLIVKLPGNGRRGETVEHDVQLIDVAPAVAALAGLAADSPSDAVLLSAPSEPRSIYSESYEGRLHFGWSELRSLVRGDHHLIDGPDPELYDLAADPAEIRSLVAERRREFAALRSELERQPTAFAPPAEVDDETRQALAALGYLGTAPLEDGRPLPDPKAMMHTLADLRSGLERFAQADYAAAKARLRRALDANPRMVDAWDYLGRSYQRLRALPQALAAYKEAIRLSGGLPEVSLATALLLLEMGEPDEARLVLSNQLGRTPKDMRIAFAHVRVLVVLGRLDEALRHAESAAAAAPLDADSRYQLGSVRMARRELAAAESELREALRLAPFHLAALSDLAVLLASQGRTAEAINLFERVLALRPGDPSAMASLAQLRR